MDVIKRNIKKIIMLFIIVLFIIFISLYYYLKSNSTNFIEEEETDEVVDNSIAEEEKIVKLNADIKGAIKNPGVYELDSDKKVIDLVVAAGGLTDEADTTYVNLAKKLSDEMVVVIYTKDQIKKAKEKETLSIEDIDNSCICPVISNDACISKDTTTSDSKSSGSNTDSKSNASTSGTVTNTKVNINTASLEELQTLSGIGAGKAKAIVDYRTENGNFEKIEDILNVSGIGESIYEKIKDNITV